MSRSSELLKAAAKALENGDDPLHFSFLSEHDVTFDECLDLAGNLALGANLIAWAIENPKKAGTLARTGMAGMALEELTDALVKLNLGAGR